MTREEEIKALSQEPCNDAVSREAVLRTVVEQYSAHNKLIPPWLDFTDLPSVTQKSGKWILLDECANSGYYCSECHKKLVKEGWSQTVKKIKFCPNCGAKMVEQKETETWHGIHAQITAPKGTFERIFNEADDDYDI